MAEVLTWVINHLPVNQAGLEIPNPTISTWENWMASCVVIVQLVIALWGMTKFKKGDHSLILWEGHR